MQIEKELKIILKISNSNYNFAVIYPGKLLWFQKIFYFSAVPIVFSVYKHKFTAE